MRKMTTAQWFVLVLAVLTVAMGVATNFATTQPPAWVQTYPWLTWVVLGGLVVLFVIIRLLQVKESQHGQSPLARVSDQHFNSSTAGVPMSPYIVGPPILDPIYFYGRDAEVERFFFHVNGFQPAPVQVLGLRRAGKTSFLRYVSHPSVVQSRARDAANILIAYVDLQTEIRNPAALYRAVAKAISCCLDAGDHLEIPTAGFPTFGAFEKWLESPQLSSHRVVILLDEFEALCGKAAFDMDFFTGLRALVTEKRVWATTSYRDLYRLSRVSGADAKTSPFFNIFHPAPIILGGLAPNAADDLIQKPAAVQGVHFVAEEIVTIERLAGLLPFFLQTAAERWFRAKVRGIAPPQAEAEVRKSFATEMDRHFNWYWAHFSDEERALLTYIATDARLDWTRYRGKQGLGALDELLAYGLIAPEGDDYHIVGSSLADWIRQRTV